MVSTKNVFLITRQIPHYQNHHPQPSNLFYKRLPLYNDVMSNMTIAQVFHITDVLPGYGVCNRHGYYNLAGHVFDAPNIVVAILSIHDAFSLTLLPMYRFYIARHKRY